MLESAYIAIFVLLVLVLYIGIRKGYRKNDSAKINRVTIIYFLGIVCWVTYLYLISFNGFIFDKSMPPKFPIFIFLPALIFILLFSITTRSSKLFESIPHTWPIYYQSFRIVMEVIILMTFTAGIIPVQATLQGYNFEILFALTAPFVGYFTFTKPILSKRIAIAWNIIGILFLLVVVSIMVSSYFVPEIWGSKEELIDIRFTKLPLILLPAFMVPSAIFVHVFSIIQIVKSERKLKMI